MTQHGLMCWLDKLQSTRRQLTRLIIHKFDIKHKKTVETATNKLQKIEIQKQHSANTILRAHELSGQ
jgi:hypothetical protein